MRAMALRWFAALSVLAVIAGCDKPQPTPRAPQAQIDPAHVIFVGGEIVTINDKQPSAEALAVKGGKIVAVGARADVEKAHKGASTQVVDLGGKTLMPGFIDAHSHYINALSVASQAKLYAPPAGPGKDVESIVAALKKFAADRKIPRGEMIMAYGYDDTVMPNGRLLYRDDLDKASPKTRSASTMCPCTGPC
jgi:predicted amidohydrolase YtcJ